MTNTIFPFSRETKMARLVRKERAAMLRYAAVRLGNADDGEDAVQDACLAVLRQLSEPRDLCKYLYRTLANICTQRLRERHQHEPAELPPAAVEAAEAAPDAAEETYRRIETLLATLPEAQAEVLRLRFHADLSFAEIAAVQGVPLSTVKSRLVYALEKLRRELAAAATH